MKAKIAELEKEKLDMMKAAEEAEESPGMREEVKRLAEEKDKMFIDNHSKEMELKR